ncbi:hypothetical protein EYF80_042638 [Liparis tanakae]|uniref:Uncharacterized protein n=1 Tax=Liparis tanakae TaxID=230148 RepID=A0A4Z2G2P7_9TELE|nr:hypothetical protein EYF80_042638 [Liparis tanakae]
MPDSLPSLRSRRTDVPELGRRTTGHEQRVVNLQRINLAPLSSKPMRSWSDFLHTRLLQA